jgi:type IV secretion system protein TrbC
LWRVHRPHRTDRQRSRVCILKSRRHAVQAAASGGGGLPWETPLETLRDSITGPVAYAISLMGVVVAGATLVFGGEINDFVRRIIMLVLVISLIIFSTNILSTLFNAGAVIQ